MNHFISINTISNTNSNTFSMENHLQMASTMRMKSRKFLDNLYETVNNMEIDQSKNERIEEIEEQDGGIEKLEEEYNSRGIGNLFLQTQSRNVQEPDAKPDRNPTPDPTIHISKMPRPNSYHRNMPQYEYREWRNLTLTLKNLARDHPELVKLTTAQEEYKLPYPGGKCKEDKCAHYIVKLTNHTINNSNKPQIYLSGEVHGDERVGPTATVELILLFVNNRKNPWFKHLLDTRLIVITPMTNPHGYASNIREELLLESENNWVLTKNRYMKTHKDINRDFPYLVKEEECMESVGARVVNELYMNHMFSLALTLHGGTESFTYPYGAPNHIQKKSGVNMEYQQDKKGSRKLRASKPVNNSLEMAKKFRDGLYDQRRDMGNSTSPPDHTGIRDIAFMARKYTTPSESLRYETGDMSRIVYPVRGGMEDWAYGGGWEGYPIINQCKPKTYTKYDVSRTDYSKNQDALKSIMFLLEISHDKFPQQMHLGRNSLDCLINLKPNAFFNDIYKDDGMCKDKLVDGYIPRILRLSLSLIDILEPYINNQIVKHDKTIEIVWRVGGAITVNKTFVLYDYVDNPDELYKKAEKVKHNTELLKLFPHHSKSFSGKAIWHPKFTEKDSFRFNIQRHNNKKKMLVFMILAKVDEDWGKQDNPDPILNPQTHIVNIRTNAKYTAKNANYKLQGQKYFSSDFGVVVLDK